jgi:hypothetical protein
MTDHNLLEKALITLCKFSGFAYGSRLTTLRLPEIPRTRCSPAWACQAEPENIDTATEPIYRQANQSDAADDWLELIVHLSSIAYR